MQYFITSSPFLRRPTASASTPTIRWITSVSCFTPCGARPRWKIWERRAVPSIASITSSRSDAIKGDAHRRDPEKTHLNATHNTMTYDVSNTVRNSTNHWIDDIDEETLPGAMGT